MKQVKPMIEQLISFETAKLAKEKGFDLNGITWLFYEENGRMWNCEYDNGDKDYRCCTQELLRKWLCEVHEMDVWAKPFAVMGDKKYLGFVGFIPNKIEGQSHSTHDTHEEAIEFALQVALKLIKT